MTNENAAHPFNPLWESGFDCGICKQIHIHETHYILVPKPLRAPGNLMICRPQLNLILGVRSLREMYADRYQIPRLPREAEFQVFETIEAYIGSLSRGALRKLKKRGYSEIKVPSRRKTDGQKQRRKRKHSSR